MHDLQLVGFTTDRRGLIFRTTAGARAESYVVPITDELVSLVTRLGEGGADGEPSLVDDAAPVVAAAAAPAAPRAESQLSVREIQARLRAGEDVARVAREAGVDEAWIERFAPPVRAEQRRIVERALACHLERPRAGASVVPLRRAVGMAMADKGIAYTVAAFDAAWSSRLIGHDRWAVQFTYRHRGKDRTAVWDFDAADGTLTTADRTASQLGFVGADGHHDPDAGTVIDGVIGDPDATPIGTAPPPPKRGRSASAGRADGDAAPAPAAGPETPTGARPASPRSTSAKKATTTQGRTKAARGKTASDQAATPKSAAERGATKQAATKKAASKKAASKKAPSKKAPSKKAPSKKAAATKSPSKKAASKTAVTATTKAAIRRGANKKAAAAESAGSDAARTKGATRPPAGRPAADSKAATTTAGGKAAAKPAAARAAATTSATGGAAAANGSPAAAAAGDPLATVPPSPAPARPAPPARRAAGDAADRAAPPSSRRSAERPAPTAPTVPPAPNGPPSSNGSPPAPVTASAGEPAASSSTSAATPATGARRRTVQVETRRGGAGGTAAGVDEGEASNPDELLRVRARRVEERLSQDTRTTSGVRPRPAPSADPSPGRAAPAPGAGPVGERALTDRPPVPRPWTVDAEPEPDRTAARRARAAERNAHTVQFRSGAAAPVRVAGAAPGERATPPPAPSAPAASGDGASAPPVDANGAARPRTRRRRQLRVR